MSLRLRRWLTPVAAVAGVIGLMAVPSAQASLLGQIVVLDTPNNEITPAWQQTGATGVNPSFLYAQDTSGHRGFFSVFLKRPGTTGVPRKLNAAGTFAQGGGIAGNFVVYQIAQGDKADLRLFDMANNQFVSLPATWNAKDANDSAPTISAGTAPNTYHVLWFRRNEVTEQHRVMLGTFTTDSSGTPGNFSLRELTHTTGFGTNFVDGQVNGNWAVWVKLSPGKAQVYREALTASNPTLLTDALGGAYRQAPSVDANGNAFMLASTKACGGTVKFIEHPASSGVVSVLFTMGSNRTILSSWVDDSSSPTSVYFAKAYCDNSNDSGIYKVNLP